MPSSDRPAAATATATATASARLGTGRTVALLLFATLVFLVAALVAPWIWQTLRGTDPPAVASGLPWQVEPHADGSSAVFGLDLGRGTLAQAARRWPEEPLQLALVRDAQAGLTLEGYVERVNAGYVQGKLVLTGRADAATLHAWAERATARAPQPSGTWRLTLTPDDHAAALDAPIAGLVFLPAARFDESTATERFGPPTERLATQDGTVHLLYPGQGVVIALDPQGRARPVLQYVAPAAFERLRAPLLHGR